MKINTAKYGLQNNRLSIEMKKIRKDVLYNKQLYILIIPVILFYILFHYVPIYGAIIAFKDFVPSKGILGSDWVGFKYFIEFFKDPYFFRIMKNTLWISLNSIIFSFPAPIIFALLLNELKNKFFKSCVQTVSYMPHFISLVVICGMIKDFTGSNGLINNVLIKLNLSPLGPMLTKPNLFIPIYIISGIWKEMGFSSIVYLAALSNVDPQLYEAARIDGANKWKQTLHVSIPGILPTIIIMLILRLGNILNVGFEKIMLLYNPAIYEVADVISTFVFRRGLQELDYSFASAIGIFNSVVNFTFLIISNKVVRNVSETSLW